MIDLRPDRETPRRPFDRASGLGRAATTAILLAVTGLATASTRLAQGQLVPTGGEFLVNTETAGDQRWPVVAIRDDGAFVIVWRSVTQNRSVISGQRYDRLGQRIQSEFQVSDTQVLSDVPHPQVAMNRDGGFVVTWTGGSFVVLARRFDNRGMPLAPGFVVTGDAYEGQDLAMGANGGFLVSWSTYYENRVYATLFDGNGRVLRRDLALNPPGDRAVAPSAVIAPDGDFVVVWVVPDPGTPFRDVVGQRFHSLGALVGSEFIVNTSTVEHLPLFGLFGPSVAMAPNGAFVVVWQSSDGSGLGVFGQRYEAGGRRAGGEFQINSSTQGEQYSRTVTMGAGGDFFVAWTSDPPGPEVSVLGRYYGPSGSPVGGDFEITTGTDPIKRDPSAAVSTDGTLVVTWSSWGGPGGDYDIRGRRFKLEEAVTGDRDGDGIDSAADNCPTIPNPDQIDSNHDGYGDDCVSPDVFIPATANLGANPVIGRGTIIQTGVTIGDDAVIGEYVRLQRQITANDRLRAEDFVNIGRLSTLGSDVSLGFATRLEGNVTIGDGTTIADQVTVRRGAVIGDAVRIDALAVLSAGARIGNGAVLEMGARIGRGATVLPGAIVPAGTSVPPATTFP